MPPWLYYLLAVLMIAGHVICMAANLFLLPGNWILVAVTAVFAWLVQGQSGQGVSWWIVGTVIGLALLGELIEFLAGAAGAAKMGGSRRGMALSMFGAMVGSIVGVVVGLPVPVVGSVLAALLGATVGSFAGAYWGEQWKGRSHEERMAIGEGAVWGRLGGTAGKLLVGVVMLVLVAWDALF